MLQLRVTAVTRRRCGFPQARSLAAEMHSGFMGVRSEFPMSVKRSRPRTTWPAHVRRTEAAPPSVIPHLPREISPMRNAPGMRRVVDPIHCVPPRVESIPQVEPEIARITEIWAGQRRRAEPGSGPFLFGQFGAVDCMFAPVVLRFASYKARARAASLSCSLCIRFPRALIVQGLCNDRGWCFPGCARPLEQVPIEDPEVMLYMDAVLSLPAMKQWVEAGLKETAVIAEADAVD